MFIIMNMHISLYARTYPKYELQYIGGVLLVFVAQRDHKPDFGLNYH